MYIGIDIGGMSIKAGIVDDGGNVLKKYTVATPLDSAESFMEAILDAVAGVCGSDVKKDEVKAIGMGFPGVVKRDDGILVSANNVPGKNLPIRSFLQEKFPQIPVLVENDANCAALGEFYRAENARDFVFVTLGTGIGGGIIIGGKLYIGANGVGGELGHIITHHNGNMCSCGRKGCWEAYASVTALKRLTEKNRNLIKSIAPDEEISGKTVFEHAKNGDCEALRVRDEWIEEVAIGITDIVNIFQPDEIVIGGAISKEGDILINPIRDYVKKNSYDIGPLKAPSIIASRIGNDAGIIGAALLEKNKHF